MATQKLISEQLRQHIAASELSQRQISLKVGVDPAQMSRFLNGQGGLSLAVIDEVGKLLGLKVTK